MGRYPLNLPSQLKQQAEAWATRQGVSLNQFILWAVSEKVGALNQQLDDPAFVHITYRRGAAGQPVPVVRGANIKVQTLIVAQTHWKMSPAQIADEYDLSETQVNDALAFYQAHREEIDAGIAIQENLEHPHA